MRAVHILALSDRNNCLLGGWSGVLMVATGAHYVIHQKCIPTNCFILFLSSKSYDGYHKPVLNQGENVFLWA